MDDTYHLDYRTILDTVRSADVVAFRFVTVQERLLIDNAIGGEGYQTLWPASR